MQFEKLVSNLDYNNRVQRSDGVVGTITQVYKDWALWALLEPTATEIYQTIMEDNASEFTVMEKPWLSESVFAPTLMAAAFMASTS